MPQLYWGIFVLLTGCAVAVPEFDVGKLLLAAPGLPVFLCGCVIALFSQAKRRYRWKRRIAHERWYARPRQVLEPKSPGHWVPTRWVLEVHENFDHYFKFHEAFKNYPVDFLLNSKYSDRWRVDTAGVRDQLKQRFVWLYGNANIADPWSLNWLIQWHCERIKGRWLAGALYGFRDRFAPRITDSLLLFLGVILGAIGVLVVGLTEVWFIGAALGMTLGGSLICMSVSDFLSRRWIFSAEKDECEVLHTDETLGYEEWLEKLSDAPNDKEMAGWLGLDKRYLKYEALRRCGLTGRELFNELILTQRAKGALRNRADDGPVRYSTYIVHVFLLTPAGVRQVKTKLDFLNGNSSDEERTSFAYGSVTSARVNEVGRRLEQDDFSAARSRQTVPLGRRSFHLVLSSGEDIEVVAENFAGFADIDRENSEHLAKLALDSAGITGALHTMESVAAEGEVWVKREGERRNQRLRDWEHADQDAKPAIDQVAVTEPLWPSGANGAARPPLRFVRDGHDQ